MKKRERQYTCCGKISFTASQAKQCEACAAKEKYSTSRNNVIAKLATLGTDNIEYVGIKQFNKTTIRFRHICCDTTQDWTISNLRKAFHKDPNTAPCSKCGASRRTKNATLAYIAKYGIDESRIDEWTTYRQVVRRLSEKTYRTYKAEINPDNLERGMTTNHLDHKMPIVQGFLNGLPPEQMAQKENLQMLTSTENLKKGRRAQAT